jgi:hypothetical protein
MTGRTHLLESPHQPTPSAVPVGGGSGWLLGDPRHDDRNFCLDLVQVHGYLEDTQPRIAKAVQISVDVPKRRQFLTRQLAYRADQTRHAIERYKTDRHPRKPLFAFARCLVHFAVAVQEVSFCTHLQGKASELPIVAISGEHDFGAGPVSEASLNGFPSSEITSRIQELLDLDSYRIDKQHQRRLPLPDTAARDGRPQIPATSGLAPDRPCCFARRGGARIPASDETPPDPSPHHAAGRAHSGPLPARAPAPR